MVQHIRVYFPDDGVVLESVPGDNDALESRVLAFLAKTGSDLPEEDSEPSGTGQFHKVDSDETLYRISRRYGVTVDKIRLLNQLGRDATIYPGQWLRVGQ